MQTSFVTTARRKKVLNPLSLDRTGAERYNKGSCKAVPGMARQLWGNPIILLVFDGGEGMPVKKSLYIALIIILTGAFAVSAFYLGSYFLEGKRQQDRFQELSQMVEDARQNASETTQTTTEPSAPTGETQPEETEPTEPQILPWYQDVYDLNHDLVGWIRIDGTVVDYPVMQTSVDNRDYYLRRDFDGSDATRGCIYVREECDVFTPSDNVTIYGHKMHDGTMFAALLDYADESVWKDNSIISFDTIYEYHTYQIFAVFNTTATVDEGFKYHRMENAANKAEFDKFIATCKDLAFYDTGITPVYGDKIICLSTCDYSLENGRFVVAAVRIA